MPPATRAGSTRIALGWACPTCADPGHAQPHLTHFDSRFAGQDAQLGAVRNGEIKHTVAIEVRDQQVLRNPSERDHRLCEQPGSRLVQHDRWHEAAAS